MTNNRKKIYIFAPDMDKKHVNWILALFFILLFASCSKDEETLQKLAPQYFNGKLLEMVDADSIGNFSYFEYDDNGRLSRIYMVDLYESFCMDYTKMLMEVGGTMLFVPFTTTKEGYIKSLKGTWILPFFTTAIDYNIQYDNEGHYVNSTFMDIGSVASLGHVYDGSSELTWENGNLKKIFVSYSTIWNSGDTMMFMDTKFEIEYTYTEIDNVWQQNTKLLSLANDLMGYSGFSLTGYLGKGSAKLPASCIVKTDVTVEYAGETYRLPLESVTSRATYELNEDGTIKRENLYSFPYLDLSELTTKEAKDVKWKVYDDRLYYSYE